MELTRPDATETTKEAKGKPRRTSAAKPKSPRPDMDGTTLLKGERVEARWRGGEHSYPGRVRAACAAWHSATGCAIRMGLAALGMLRQH